MQQRDKPGARPLTRNVYLDTNVHVASKFGYAGGNVRRLLELAEGGLVDVYDTRVDEGEIRAQIKKTADDVVNSLRRFQRDGVALRAVHQPEVRALFKELGTEEVEGYLLDGYGEFRRRSRVHRIPLPPHCAEHVLDMYFEAQAPFGVGKKKSEFPDAIIVTALKDWCTEQGEQMYVITDDAGMFESATRLEGLHPMKRLDEFLSRIVSKEHHALALFANKWLADRKEDLVHRVSNAFLDGGFYLDDADGDVENIEIETLQLSTPLLVEVVANDVVFSTAALVVFQADISYDDPSTGIYDSEEKEMVFMERRQVRVRREDEYHIEFKLRTAQIDDATAEKPANAEIVAVEIEEGRDVVVSSEDDIVEVYSNPETDYEWYADPLMGDEEPIQDDANDRDLS